MAQDMMSTGNTILNALISGQADLRARYRFERVSQAGFTRKASANTLLLRPGYTTGEAFGLSARIDVDTVMQIGKERFNDTVNGNAIYPVIADPDIIELNQAYLKFKGIPDTTLIGGRQRIKFDNDRFIGNVGFRQNEQTYDTATVINKSIDHLELRYDYMDSVQRIFGEQAVAGDFNTSNHLIHIAYKRFPIANLTGYAYLLDIDDSAGRFSSETYGLRLTGKYDLGGPVLSYQAEYAQQEDYEDNPANFDLDYYHVAPKISFKGPLNGTLAAWIGYEVLEGDGTNGFQTVLATLHAHQGWADKFLTTPATGIEDTYGGASYKIPKVFGLDFIRFMAVYHEFDADTGGADLGEELDLLAAAKFMKKYTMTLKFAGYKADTFATDTEKIWMYFDATFKF